MQFSVGDKIVYPGKGVGRVVGTRRQELVEGFENYYVIEISEQELTVSVPMRMTSELGVRSVMSRRQLTRVLDTLRDVPTQLPKGYRKRQEQIREKLKTGRPLQIAEVVRDLTWHQQVAHATKKDADLLTHGRQFLAGEIALLSNDEIATVRNTIDAALAIATAKASSKGEPRQASVA